MARSIQLLQQTLETNFQRFMNFLGFARGFILRKNPIKAMVNEIVSVVKEFLTMNKKLKMARYRLHYHQNQLYKMEQLISENNEHSFLKGKNINQVR